MKASKTKRILAALLAVSMILTMGMITASADDTVPAPELNAWTQASHGGDTTPANSGELITDDILWLEATTDLAAGTYKLEWRVKDAEDGSDWSGWSQCSTWKSCFDFISLVNNFKHHKTYEFRTVVTGENDEKSYSEASAFEVNIDVKNVPALVGIDGTKKAGSSDVYTSPVTVNVEGRHVADGTGYFIYYNGSEYVYRYVSQYGYTFTEPGTYSYVRYFDSRSQQIEIGSFTIVPDLKFTLGSVKADGSVNYAIEATPFADKVDNKALKYVLIDGNKVVALGAATATFEKSNIKLMDYAGKTVTIRAQNGDALNAAIIYAETEYTFPTPKVELNVATHNNNSAKWMIGYEVTGVTAASQIKWRLYRPDTDQTITLTGGSPGASWSCLKTEFFRGETVVIRAYTANPPAALLGEAEYTFTEGKEPPTPEPVADLQDALSNNEVVDGGGYTYEAELLGEGIKGFGIFYDPTTLKNATLTASGAQYNFGTYILGTNLNVTLENINTDVRNSSLYIPQGSNGNTVTVTGGVFKGAGSSANGAIIGIQDGTNNTVTVTGAELRLTTSTGTSSGNGHLVYLQGAGNIVNFVNCTFYVNGSKVNESQIATSSRFIAQGGSQIQVNGVKVKG
jgi:hypothetical protein